MHRFWSLYQPRVKFSILYIFIFLITKRKVNKKNFPCPGRGPPARGGPPGAPGLPGWLLRRCSLFCCCDCRICRPLHTRWCMHTSAKEVPADDCWSRFSFLANFSASSSGANLLPLALLLTRLCVFRFCVHFWLRSVCLQLIILPSYLQLRVEYDTFTRRCMPGIRQKQIVCSNEDGDDADEFFYGLTWT